MDRSFASAFTQLYDLNVEKATLASGIFDSKQYTDQPYMHKDSRNSAKKDVTNDLFILF